MERIFKTISDAEKRLRTPHDKPCYLLNKAAEEEFLKNNGPQRQLQVLGTPEACVFGESPTLITLANQFGEGSPKHWLVIQLTNVSLSCGLKEDATAEQLLYCAVAIFEKYGYLKVDELQLFFARFKGGEYERFYARFDPQIVMQSLKQFLYQRARIYEERENKQREEEREKQREEAVSYEEFCRRKGRDPITYHLGDDYK